VGFFRRFASEIVDLMGGGPQPKAARLRNEPVGPSRFQSTCPPSPPKNLTVEGDSSGIPSSPSMASQEAKEGWTRKISVDKVNDTCLLRLRQNHTRSSNFTLAGCFPPRTRRSMQCVLRACWSPTGHPRPSSPVPRQSSPRPDRDFPHLVSAWQVDIAQ
jgi:hypothetical protein